MTNLLDMTALELTAQYATRAASPVEVINEVLSKAESSQSTLNAFCAFDADGARQAARESEERWTRGKQRGFLDGVPVAIKDNLHTATMPTRYGSRTVRSAAPYGDDAPAAARLREAGTVVFAKTTLCEYGYSVTSKSPLTGTTRNPWNLDHTSGGSSAGSAAAVAARICPVALGTDGGGSVRVPAAWSGLFGLKPSFGRVPHFPRGAFANLSHIGPLTRSVRDAAAVMDVISRPDSRDWYALPYDATSYFDAMYTPLAGKRVAYSETLGQPDLRPDPEVIAALGEGRRALMSLGAIVEDVDPPCVERASANHRVFWTSYCARISAAVTPEVRQEFDPGFAELATFGADVSREKFVNALIDRGEVGREINQFFTRYDLVLCPTFPTTAPTLVQMETKSYFPSMTAWCNQAGIPAASVPCGRSSAGLPLAVQVVGRQYDDRMVMAASAALEGVLRR